LHIGFLAFYDSSTFNGSSGSPVVKVVEGKLQVVALHRFRTINQKCRAGSILTEILRHACFIEEEGTSCVVQSEQYGTYHCPYI